MTVVMKSFDSRLLLFQEYFVKLKIVELNIFVRDHRKMFLSYKPLLDLIDHYVGIKSKYPKSGFIRTKKLRI